jgi:hypothetical protein
MTRILAALLALALMPAATAQSDCTSSATPCPLVVVVDANGFGQDKSWAITQDEWYAITVYNLDDKAHTVTLSGYDVTLQAPADGEASAVVQFTRLGSFQLKDAPTGATATITVVGADSVDYEEGRADGSGNPIKKSPGLAIGLLALGLVAVALHRRA